MNAAFWVFCLDACVNERLGDRRLPSSRVTRTNTASAPPQATATAAGERVAVVTLGGGSSMDAGKAIAMLAGQGPNATILDYTICPALGEDNEVGACTS
jgi:hypothetical protein